MAQESLLLGSRPASQYSKARLLSFALLGTLVIALLTFAVTESLAQARDDLTSLEAGGAVPGYSSWLKNVGGSHSPRVQQDIVDAHSEEIPRNVLTISNENVQQRDLALGPLDNEDQEKN